MKSLKMTKLLSRAALSVLALPRLLKQFIALLSDAFFCVMTVCVSFYLRLGDYVSLKALPLKSWLVALSIALPIFIVSGLYRAIFRYSGWAASIAVARAVGLYGLSYALVFTGIGIQGVPRTVGLIQPLLLFFTVVGARLFVRYWLGEHFQTRARLKTRPKAVVYGAGIAGRQLASAMAHSYDLKVVGFLDDDDRLQGHMLNNLPIYNPDHLPKLMKTKGVTDVLLAIPSLGRKRRNEILEKMLTHHVAVRTLPSLSDLAQGKIMTTDLKDLDIDDLLGRNPIAPDERLMAKTITDKVVMVTGAGGSIGSELCRQIIKLHPVRLLLVEISEYALYSVHSELESLMNPEHDFEVIPLLASVQDNDRMREIVETWKPHTIYHAAAYKHVPLVEHNPAEGVKNNVFGTLVTTQAALEYKVSDFVLISTDKAVRPTNIMGASKRLAEMILQAFAATSTTTKFSMVRFGNVLASSGSVVPKFRRQIRNGGPVTLTHPEINRFFMTIPEAAQLVIQAGAMAQGSDVFVLDMGEPVKIMDLATRMIELSGLSVRTKENPEGDIEIAITGLRPGEKLYEELLIGNNPQLTSHPRIMKASEEFIPWKLLESRLKALYSALEKNDVEEIRKILEALVSGYQSKGGIVDWVCLERKKLKAQESKKPLRLFSVK